MEHEEHPTTAESPCRDHCCDQCAACRKGRCCRKDNPDYGLPALGDWDGPIFGRLGVLADDGTRIQCHACGRYFLGLAHHVIQSHYLLPDEYRVIFGLNRDVGLIGHVHRKRLISKTCKSRVCIADSNRRDQLAQDRSGLPEVGAKQSATKRALAAARLMAVAALP
ncbi:MAG: hypothetical protein KGJ86_08905 [Chloroflexota bacterium]|nr:hypothetical protein [Chloroflexota bacterium]